MESLRIQIDLKAHSIPKRSPRYLVQLISPDKTIRLKDHLDPNIPLDENIFIDETVSLANGDHTLSIQFFNDPVVDNLTELDGRFDATNLTVVRVGFDSLWFDDRLPQLARYYPEKNKSYLDWWASQRKPAPEYFTHTTMGWDGQYLLKFRTPIFEWFLDIL